MRGLHFQSPPKSETKIVRCISGAIWDVIVDIRLGSPNFGKSIKIRLDSDLHNMVYVPEGFAHGYLVLEERTIIQYKCTNYYDPTSEFGIRWDDIDLNISWDVTDPIISDRDKNLPQLKEQNKQLLNENVIVDKDQITPINDSSEEKNTFIEKHEIEEDVLKLTDPIDQNLQEKEEVNRLENFGLEENQTTELFNSETEKTTDEDEGFTSFANDEVRDSEDDLEIPAFLRRQKN